MASQKDNLFRLASVFVLSFCLILLSYAYYLEIFQLLDPCPLCIFQRIAFIFIATVAFAAAIHNPAEVGKKIYSVFIVIGSTIGIFAAGRHIYLQSLPPDLTPECGPGLNFMLDNFPIITVLEKTIYGSGECAAVSWTFLGFSMPWWSLFWFCGLSIIFVIFSWRSSKT